MNNFSSYARTLDSVIDESRFIMTISKEINEFITLVTKVKVKTNSPERKITNRHLPQILSQIFEVW